MLLNALCDGLEPLELFVEEAGLFLLSIILPPLPWLLLIELSELPIILPPFPGLIELPDLPMPFPIMLPPLPGLLLDFSNSHVGAALGENVGLRDGAAVVGEPVGGEEDLILLMLPPLDMLELFLL